MGSWIILGGPKFRTFEARVGRCCSLSERALLPSVGPVETEKSHAWNFESPVLEIAQLIFVCILVAGCHSRSAPSGPSIEFTRIPPAAEGGPDKLDIIEGRVIGGAPGQHIVLYAKSGAWWVQPLVNETFTKVQANSKWINSTHLGTEYAAMLVEPSYRPPTTINALPKPGGGVAAVAIAQGAGAGSSVSKTLSFSGYEWRIVTRQATAVE